jgi:hypothetical protein
LPSPFKSPIATELAPYRLPENAHAARASAAFVDHHEVCLAVTVHVAERDGDGSIVLVRCVVDLVAEDTSAPVAKDGDATPAIASEASDREVRFAVTVDIPDRHATRDIRIGLPHRVRDGRAEGPLALVEEDAHAFPGDGEVELAIAIEVPEGHRRIRAEGQTRGVLGGSGEQPGALVPKKAHMLPGSAGDGEVGLAVAVHVSDGHLTKTHAVDTSRREGPVAVVAEHAHSARFTTVIGGHDVRLPVAIHVA